MSRNTLTAAAVLVAIAVVAAGLFGWQRMSSATRRAIEAEGRLEEQRTRTAELEEVARADSSRVELLQDSVEAVLTENAAAWEAARASGEEAARQLRRARANAATVARGDTALSAVLDSLNAATEARVVDLENRLEAAELRRVEEVNILLRRIEATDSALVSERAVSASLRVQLATALERGDAYRDAARPGLFDWAQRIALVGLAADKILGG